MGFTLRRHPLSNCQLPTPQNRGPPLWVHAPRLLHPPLQLNAQQMRTKRSRAQSRGFVPALLTLHPECCAPTNRRALVSTDSPTTDMKGI